MRLLCIHPGADWSTADLYNGLVPALEAEGVECIPYALNTRLDLASSWLNAAWERAGRPEQKPTDADVAYKASIDSIERALRLNVDYVLIFSAMYFHPDALILLRRAGLKIALILTESPYEDEAEKRLLQWADIAWTHERSALEPYRAVNQNVQYLPHAFDPRTHRPRSPSPDDLNLPAHDVVFVGTPFPERVRLLEQVDWAGVDLGLYGFWNEAVGPQSALASHVRGGVTDNAVTASLYRRAKIGLNLYRTSRHFDGSGEPVTGAESLNPRALELAACETFQLSDYRPEVSETFGPSVPTFTTPAELEALVWKFMHSPSARSICAGSARLRLTHHSFADRAQQVVRELVSVHNGVTIERNAHGAIRG